MALINVDSVEKNYESPTGVGLKEIRREKVKTFTYKQPFPGVIAQNWGGGGEMS